MKITGYCGTNVEWELDRGVLVVEGKGQMADYSIDSEPPWCNVKKLVIKEGITHIGNYAFAFCEKLRKVYLPDSLISIGNSAFAGCIDLTKITVPNSVTSIGEYAFCKSLTEISLPKSLTSIGYGAFYGLERS